MSVLILPPPVTRVTKAPALVETLRAQIKRKAALSLLARIAGGEAELRRLDRAYALGVPFPDAKPAVVPLKVPMPTHIHGRPRQDGGEPLHGRQARLFAMLGHLASVGEVFPGPHPLAEALACSWLQVERDLAQMQRRGFIRITTHKIGARSLRRVAIANTRLSTALPGVIPGRPLELEANGVR